MNMRRNYKKNSFVAETVSSQKKGAKWAKELVSSEEDEDFCLACKREKKIVETN